MIAGSWSFRELLVWKRWGVHENRKYQVRHPCLWNPEDDIDRMNGKFKNEIIKKLYQLDESDTVIRIALESLIAACLKNSREEEFRFLFEEMAEMIPSFNDLFPFFGQLETDDFFWEDSRWVMTSSGGGGVYSMLIGVSKSRSHSSPGNLLIPKWWGKVADKSAQAAVEDALSPFVKEGFHIAFWPIVPFHNRLFISGKSIGLSVFAGALAAMEKREIPKGLVFSGIVTPKGHFKKPSHLGQKIRVVSCSGFDRLVFSTEEDRKGKGEGIAVCNEEELKLVLRYYSQELGDSLLDSCGILKTPENLSARIHHLKEPIIMSGFFPNTYRKAVKELLLSEDERLLKDFARNLERFCLNFDNAPDVCLRLLEPLTDELLDRLSGTCGEAVWRIVMCKYASFTAAGNPEMAGKCYLKAIDFLPKQEQGKRLADVQNRYFVHKYHLCFRFEPKIPKDFLNTMKSFEKVRELMEEKVSPVLGRMYGTVAQNYGFCGPEYLEKTEEFVRKAQDAFGGGTVRELREDWLREFNYLVYAYLDASLFNKAEDVLKKYLEIDSIDAVTNVSWDRWNRFKHAALARFIAETRGADLAEYFIKMFRHGRKIKKIHPWQLWLFNAGRVVKERELKRDMWRMSCEIALGLNGPPKAMALLPLAWLYAEGLENKDFLKGKTAEVLDAIKRMKQINHSHFKRLFIQGSFSKILAEVKKDCSILFPFTYR